jgi:hypothetical protein
LDPYGDRVHDFSVQHDDGSTYEVEVKTLSPKIWKYELLNAMGDRIKGAVQQLSGGKSDDRRIFFVLNLQSPLLDNIQNDAENFFRHTMTANGLSHIYIMVQWPDSSMTFTISAQNHKQDPGPQNGSLET